MSIFCYQNEVFYTDAVLAFNIDTRLDGEDHTRFSHIFIDRADISVFMVFLSDEVSKADLPVFAVAFFVDVVSCLCINITETCTRFDRSFCLFDSGADNIMNVSLLIIYALAVESSCHI